MEVSKEMVSQALLDYRAKNQLSQEAIAQKLGCSPMQILRWEKKKTLPNILSLKMLKEFKILSYGP